MPLRSSAGAPLAFGQLQTADGAPAAGTAQAWNTPRRGSSKPVLLGEAQTDASGNYSVQALDDARLPPLARANGGQTIDVMVTANIPGATGAMNLSLTVSTYNDGTVARFAYSQLGSASTSFSVAQGYETKAGKIGFSFGGKTSMDDKGKVKFPPARARIARKLRTQFEFTKRGARTNTCALFYTEVRATSFIGGTDVALKNPVALDKCRPEALLAYIPGGGFERETGSGAENSAGAEAFGATLSTTTSFSKNAVLTHDFGGRGGAKHYACGPDGVESPLEARSVYSGALR